MSVLLLSGAVAALAGAPTEPSESPFAAPPGAAGWHTALRPQHHLHLAALAEARARPPPVPWACPNATWAEAVEVAGLLSVKLFGAVGNGSHDDAEAVRRAMNATTLCGGCVFFPPGRYFFNSTVALAGCVKGSQGGGGTDGTSEPMVDISGGSGIIPVTVNNSLFLSDVAVHGDHCAIYIVNTAGVRFVNVGAHASVDADHGNYTEEGCNATACNVVLGSMSAAMVVENSFWLWFERVAFSAQGLSGSCPHPYKTTPTNDCQWGQRPTVLLRGRGCNPGERCGVAEVYLVRFDRAIFTGGGVQYQQLVNDTGGSPAGWFDFVSCTQEVSATPLLDLQSADFRGYFPGLQQVVIRDYMNADTLPPRFGAGGHAIAAINCTAQGCMFDGLTISSAGLDLKPAVRVYAGGVAGTTLLTASRNIYSGQGVVDRFNRPRGTWKQTSGAGWIMSGPSSEVALSFQPSGEMTPRKVIHADGSEAWRRAGAAEDEPPSVLSGHLSSTSEWDPPPLQRGEVATTTVLLPGAELGDALSCGHSAVLPTLHTVQITASAGEGVAKAVLHNLGEPVDIPAGRLRVVAAKML